MRFNGRKRQVWQRGDHYQPEPESPLEQQLLPLESRLTGDHNEIDQKSFGSPSDKEEMNEAPADSAGDAHSSPSRAGLVGAPLQHRLYVV